MAGISNQPTMQRRNNQHGKGGHEHPLKQEISQSQKQLNERAHDEAIHDIEDDPDFSAHTPNDDLDEGETARLGEDRTDLV